MNEKSIRLTVIVAVIAIGAKAIVGLAMSITGQAARERNFCTCTLQQYDFYGNPAGAEVHRLRDVRPESGEHAKCQELCLKVYRQDKNTLVTGEVEEFRFRRPRPYQQQVGFPSRI